MLLATTVFAQQGPPPATVVAGEARTADLAPTVNVPGTVYSRNDARLAAEVEGRLTWIADVGTRVKAGEPVARIDDTILRLQRDEYVGLVGREQARLTFLEPEVERLRKLALDNNTARSRLDETTSDMEVARSDLVVAQSRLKQIEDQLRRTSVSAPFAGVVTEKLRNLGERVALGDEIIRMLDPTTIEVIARAPLHAVNYISEGNDLHVTSDYRDGSGSVRTIVPFGDPQSHMFEVRVDVPADQWTVGESVRLSVPTAQPRNVLAVPRDALVLRREGATVYRIKEDNTAEQVSVLPGIGAGDLVEVTGDLRAGEKIIVRGAERLRPGQPLNVIDNTPGATPATASN